MAWYGSTTVFSFDRDSILQSAPEQSGIYAVWKSDLFQDWLRFERADNLRQSLLILHDTLSPADTFPDFFVFELIDDDARSVERHQELVAQYGHTRSLG